jgi:hypothetical protein
MVYHHTQTGVVIIMAFVCAIAIVIAISISAPTSLPVSYRSRNLDNLELKSQQHQTPTPRIKPN